MKRYIRSGILALSLSALPLGLSALAQTGGQQGYQGYQDRTTTTTRTDGGGSNWGWLGLLGLIGLAGLGRRRRLVTCNRTNLFPVAGAWKSIKSAKSPLVFSNLTTIFRAPSGRSVLRRIADNTLSRHALSRQ